jgi:hypothetical protein
MNYVEAKSLMEAQDVARKYQGIYSSRVSDRACRVERAGWSCVYSPQELRVMPKRGARPQDNTDRYNPQKVLPEGVTWHYYSNPSKEYVGLMTAKGQEYYIVPRDGLRLRRVGEVYEVLNPVQDYRVVVDRKLSAEARSDEEIATFFEYVSNIWDMLTVDCIPQGFKASGDNAQPKMNDKASWFNFTVQAKWWAMYNPRSRWGGWYSQKPNRHPNNKDTTLSALRKNLTSVALAFSATPQSPSSMHHNEHWKHIDALREAGRL